MNKELVFYSEVTNLKTLGFYDSAWTQCGVISLRFQKITRLKNSMRTFSLLVVIIHLLYISYQENNLSLTDTFVYSHQLLLNNVSIL